VHAALGTLREFCEEGCYAADPEIATLANKMTSKEQKGFVLKIGESTLPNDITIYGTEEARRALATVAEAYPHLWEDSGQITRVPEKEWMTVPLKSEAKPDLAKVYPLGKEDREFVDKEFDKLHEQSRLEWTRVLTSHSYPVFVVWRTVHSPNDESKRKNRVVIDIRGLNRDTIPDTYPILL
jgi:hypothetical protein